MSSFDREAWTREALDAARDATGAAGFPEAGDKLRELSSIQLEQVRCRLINLHGQVHVQHQDQIRRAIDALGVFWGRR